MTEEFPEFSLGKIKLRKFFPDDVDAVFKGLSDPLVIAHYDVSYSSLGATDEQMRWFDQIFSEKSGIWWAIADRQNNSVVGACGFNAWSRLHRSVDLGYWLMPEHWRQGILSEALPTIIRYAFREMGIHRLHADVDTENLASCALLRKLGFHLDGTQRDVEYKEGKFVSVHQYSLLASDGSASELLSDCQLR